MAFELATAFVRVGTKTSGLSAGLNAAKNIVLGSLRNIASTAATLGGLVGGVGLGAAVKIAAAGEEMQSMFKSVFQEGSADAEKFATDMALKLGRSVGDVMGQMAGFQDLFVPLGFARDSAKELSKQLTTLTQDVSSFKDKSPDEVARDFNSALVGNHETVRKYGVVITEAALKQELLRMGFKGNAQAATEQQKVQARLNLLMAGTKDAQGDAAKTAGSFTNRMRGLTGAIKDTLGIIGSAFLPALANIAKVASDALRSIGPRLQAWASDFAKWGKVLTSNWQLTWDIIKAAVAVSVETIKSFFFQIPELWAFSQGNLLRIVVKTFQTIGLFIFNSMNGVLNWLMKRHAQVWENILALVEGRNARDLLGDSNPFEGMGLKLQKMGAAFAAGFEGKSFLGDVFEESDGEKKAKARLNELLNQAKKAKDALDNPTPEEAKKTKLDVGQINVAKWDIPKGMFGFSGINDAIQEAMLKANNPQEKANDLIEQGNGVRQQMLAGIQKVIKNTTGIAAPPQVATS